MRQINLENTRLITTKSLRPDQKGKEKQKKRKKRERTNREGTE